MSIATVAVAIVIVIAVPLGLVGTRITTVRSLLWGAAAAAIAGGAFLALRLTSSYTLWLPYPSAPLARFVMVALVEEAAKSVLVSIAVARGEAPRRGAQRIGIGIGAGFAALENLLYLTRPLTTVITRVATAGTLHIATGWWYGRCATTVTPPRPAPWSYPLAFVTAATVHFFFNLLLHALDQTLIPW